MAQRQSNPTLPKLPISDQRFAAGDESSPKNDISWRLLQKLPSYIEPSKVLNLVLRVEYFGSWETPRDQWKTGFSLMATTSSGSEKYVKNYLLSQHAISAIKQECDAIAKALKTTFIDTTINFNLEA
ncbi:hypothetical protein AB4425_17110 [Vibrio sp. 10N.261.51.A1]|uniref:hypothetical protein n=1 Tax=unclassified Vibrio TaxID=2614977 RepID=UPI00354E3E18